MKDRYFAALVQYGRELQRGLAVAAEFGGAVADASDATLGACVLTSSDQQPPPSVGELLTPAVSTFIEERLTQHAALMAGWGSWWEKKEQEAAEEQRQEEEKREAKRRKLKRKEDKASKRAAEAEAAEAEAAAAAAEAKEAKERDQAAKRAAAEEEQLGKLLASTGKGLLLTIMLPFYLGPYDTLTDGY